MLRKFPETKIKLEKGALLLREARAGDAKALNNIANEPEVNQFIYLPAPISLKKTRQYVRNRKRYGKLIVAELDGRLAGNLDLRPNEGRKSHVMSFGIAFSHDVWGTGAAEETLKAVCDYLRRNGIETVSSSVFEDNGRGRGFHKKMGFREVCLIPGRFKRESGYVGEIIIEKSLRENS